MNNAHAKFFASIIFALGVVTGLKAENYEEGKIYKHQLENGLTVFTIERHIAPTIFQQLTYRVGSRNETTGQTGISHVVEHMMFKGTNKYNKGSISKTIADNSGFFNAFTSNDMTSYYEYLPKNKIDISLDIESDRMLNSKFDQKEFTSEIEVIKQERRLRTESSSTGIYREELYSIAFKNHPRRNPVIGWASDLARITRDEAYKYYKTYYTPNNAFLVLVGDFNTEEMLQKVKKYFANVPKGPDVPELYAKEERQLVQKSFEFSHPDIAAPSISYNFHVPIITDSDAAAIKLAGKILCEKSRMSRMYKLMVDEKKYATGVSGGVGISKDPDLFNITIKLKNKRDIDSVKYHLEKEIEKFQKDLVTDKELQRVKNNLIFQELTSYTKNADIGSRLSTYEAYFGYEWIQKFSENLAKVTKKDIQVVAKKYFDPSKAIIGITLPEKASKKGRKKAEVPAENEENNGNDNNFYLTYPCPIFGEKNSLAEGDSETIEPVKIAPKIKSAKLSNGIKVYTIENNLTPDLSINGVIETGVTTEGSKEQKPGIQNFLASVMNFGNENETATELTERLSLIPITFSIGGGLQSLTFSGHSLIKDINEMMETGFATITKPRFDDNDIEKIREDLKINAKNRINSKSMEAFYYMYNKVYQKHPLSENFSTENSIKSITKEDLKNFHAKYVRPEHLTLFINGNLSHKEMVKLAEKYFGKWKVKGNQCKLNEMPKVKELEGKELKVFTEKGYNQCTINFGFSPRNDLSPEDETAIDVLNNILAASSLTSRIGVELRDKQGLFYGFKSEVHSQESGTGYWKMNTKTAPKNVKRVIKGVFEQIKLLLDKGVTDEELANAKKTLIGQLTFSIETPDDIARIAIDYISNKKSVETFDNKVKAIQSVSKDDLIKIAKKYLPLDKWVIVVDGPIESNSLDDLIKEL